MGKFLKTIFKNQWQSSISPEKGNTLKIHDYCRKKPSQNFSLKIQDNDWVGPQKIKKKNSSNYLWVRPGWGPRKIGRWLKFILTNSQFYFLVVVQKMQIHIKVFPLLFLKESKLRNQDE